MEDMKHEIDDKSIRCHMTLSRNHTGGDHDEAENKHVIELIV